jgi:hypothetical protein
MMKVPNPTVCRHPHQGVSHFLACSGYVDISLYIFSLVGIRFFCQLGRVRAGVSNPRSTLTVVVLRQKRLDIPVVEPKVCYLIISALSAVQFRDY